MTLPPLNLQVPPFTDRLPAPLVFRTASVPADAAYPKHRHPWGEFVFSLSGVMEVQVGKRHYLAPSQYGLWLPPNVEHQGLNRYATCHSSLYVDASAAELLPKNTCALIVTPLMRALLMHLHQYPPMLPYSEPESRLLQVLLDQLVSAECAGSYLPTSTDPLLGKVLQTLEHNPGDTRSIAELAKAHHTTERTLMRHSQRDLGMPLAEWRQRLRIVKSMPRLEAGEKVESIALDLGYASASAFIAMFRRLMGTTPDEYRKNAPENL